MAYCTPAQIRAYLDQVDSSQDTLLSDIADRATGIVDRALGKDIRFTSYTTSSKVVHIFGRRWVGYGSETDDCAPYRVVNTTEWLRIFPYDLGSITSIVDADGVTITDYSEQWDYGDFYLWRNNKWTSDYYTVTADFGYGLPPPEIVEVTIEIAVNIWKSRQDGLFSDVIGVETAPGGAAVVGYQGALTNQQRMIIKGVQRRYRGFFV